jgi:nucleoside diphosphate kinase
MVKPDGVQRGLVGEILRRFEQKGFKLIAMKFMQVSLSFMHASLRPESNSFIRGLGRNWGDGGTQR